MQTNAKGSQLDNSQGKRHHHRNCNHRLWHDGSYDTQGFQNGWNYRMSNFLPYQLCALVVLPLAYGVDIPVHAGDNLQTKINSAACGDTLTLDVRAGGTVTWDGDFTLPNAGCGSGNPITMRSANHASLPAGRVGPADVENMAEIRATGTGGTSGAAIEWAVGASNWIIDGIYFSDNAGTLSVQFLIDAREGSSNTITHSYFVQKENGTGAPYHRSVVRAMQCEASSTIFKWNYVDNIIGYDYSGVLNTTQAILAVGGCSDSIISDNFIGYWYSGLFLGGGDTAPTQTATLTGATLSSATFSNTTGITGGSTVMRFDIPFVGTLIPGCINGSCTGSIVRTSGTVLTGADIFNSNPMATASILVGGGPPDSGNLLQITAISGNNYTISWVGGGTHPTAGSYNFTMYQTATVTSVVGSTVNYTPDPAMHDVLLHSGATGAAWRPVADYSPRNITVTKNTFHTDPTFGAYVKTNNGNCPKGGFEIKNIATMLYEGNTHNGYPGTEAFTATNQNGSAPWSVVRDVTVRSNWYNWDTGTPCNAQGFILADNSYLHTVSPIVNVEFSNNLVSPAAYGVLAALQINATIGTLGFVSFFHNTHFGDVTMGGSYNSALTAITAIPSLTYRDNITNYLGNGLQCLLGAFALCYSGGTFLNNVPIDSQAQGFGTNVWGTNSVLSPIETNFPAIGFTNYAGGVYSLSNSSPFKGAGTSGSDPGVDWATLQAALGGSPATPSTSITGRTIISGSATIH